MNKIFGLAFFLVVLGAAAFAFSPRPLPAFPATAVSASRVLLLGVATADRRVVAVGERGVVVVSDDEGRSWRVAKTPTEITLTPRPLRRRPARLRGRPRRGDPDDRGCRRDLDAGARGAAEEKPLFAVWFENADRGIAAGAYSSLYQTTDGGRRWEPMPAPEGDRHFNALAGGADGKLLLVGESGLIMRSGDAGRSWTMIDSPYKGSFFGVLRLGDASWLTFGLRGNAFRSDDDGDSWNSVTPAGAGPA